MKEYYTLDYRRNILKCFRTSDDGKNQEVHEYIDKKEYDDLAKQLEYANKKIENRDIMIEELKADHNSKALKGTIRGLEKSRNKLQAENNSLRKKMFKDAQRFKAELDSAKQKNAGQLPELPELPDRLVLEIGVPYHELMREEVILNDCVYEIVNLIAIDCGTCKVSLMLNALKTLYRREKNK